MPAKSGGGLWGEANMSKEKIIYLALLVCFVGAIVTWNYAIRRPQIDTAVAFLESLKMRDAARLKQVVVSSEYQVYKELYLRNGFGKRLISYGKPTEKDANGYFFPTESRFGVKLQEDDILFGKRNQDYLITLQNEHGKWRVLQFVTQTDYADLAILRQIKNEAPKQQPEPEG
jgi:hypothetical protein